MISQAFISLVFEGELQIEWGYPGHYLEVELRSDGTFRTMAEFDGATQTSTLLEPEQVIGMLRRLGLGSA